MEDNNQQLTTTKDLSKVEDKNLQLFNTARESSTIKSVDDTAIRAMLLYVMKMVGVINLPTETEEVVLLDYIHGSLADHTLDEFKLAFKLYCDGRLDTDREHFQKLSGLYIGRIMESYRRWRYSYVKLIVDQADQPHTPTSEDDEKIKQGCLRAFKVYKETQYFQDFGNVYFRFLERKEILTLSNERKHEIFLRAEEIYKALQVQLLDSIREIVDNIRTASSSDKDRAKVQGIAREIALKEYFDFLIENEIPIETLFEKQ